MFHPTFSPESGRGIAPSQTRHRYRMRAGSRSGRAQHCDATVVGRGSREIHLIHFFGGMPHAPHRACLAGGKPLVGQIHGQKHTFINSRGVHHIGLSAFGGHRRTRVGEGCEGRTRSQ